MALQCGPMSEAVRLLTLARVLRERASGLLRRVPEHWLVQVRQAEQQTADAEALLHRPHLDEGNLEHAETLLQSANDTLDLIERAG